MIKLFSVKVTIDSCHPEAVRCHQEVQQPQPVGLAVVRLAADWLKSGDVLFLHAACSCSACVCAARA